MTTLTVTKLRDNIYEFTEDSPAMNVDAYLLIGKKRAIMIDGLMDADGLLAKARELTDFPLDMIVAHGHPDHAGKGTKEFMDAGCPVYMRKEDMAILPTSGFDYPEEAFTWMKDGDNFDLGGVTLEVIALTGHTPGSCILYCPEENVIFSSDSLGSGDIWMWLPYSTSLSEYRKNLTPVLEFVRKHPDVVIYPGHAAQVPNYRGDGEGRIDLAYVEDLMEITTDLIEGRKTGHPIENPVDIMAGVDVCIASGKIMSAYTYDRQKIR